MKTIDLSSLKGADLVAIHNAISPDSPVAKFKNLEAGQAALNMIIPEKNKGKNKSLFASQVAGLPIALLTILAGAIPVAKDLTTKLFPAHLRMLSALEGLDGHANYIQKDDLAKKGLKVKTDDAKFSTILEELYKLNLVLWEENDDLMLTDAAHNFILANKDAVDEETAFADLVAAKAKVAKEKVEGSARKHTPDAAFITPLIKENPCQKGKGRAASYEIWLGKEGKKRITVGEYKAAGGGMFDLLDAVKRERITIDEA